MYLVHLKDKARSQKATRILKSQIGHVTRVSWLTWPRLLITISVGRGSHFQQFKELSEGLVEAR